MCSGCFDMVEISWVEDIVSRFCTVAGEPCLEGGDVVSTGLGGLVAGTVAVWVYIWRKNDEYANRRNDVARIQANEIASNMGVLCMQRGRQLKRAAAPRAPTMEIYEGLLSSGNIRYLGDDLQEMLAHIRHDLRVRPLDPDVDLHAQVLRRLDEIRGSHDRHFTMLPLWMWHARRKLRLKK